MYKNLLFTLLLLLCSNRVYSQGFEYVFDKETTQNQSPVIYYITELSNGNFFLTGNKISSEIYYLYCFSPEGELMAEKVQYMEKGYTRRSSRDLFKETKNGNRYLFRALNPIWDTTNMYYLPNIYDAKIVMYQMDQNFDFIDTTTFFVPLDTAHSCFSPIINHYFYPYICLNSVLETENEGFIVCFDKFIDHSGSHPYDKGTDTTFFMKIDNSGNILHTGFIRHPQCNLSDNGIHHNALLYDSSLNKYLFYTNSSSISNKLGLSVYHLNTDFQVTEEHTMYYTLGHGIHSFFLESCITLKRTSQQTTMLGGPIWFHKFVNGLPESFDGAVCMEMDDQMNIVDTVRKSIHLCEGGRLRTQTPEGICLDWIDENKIFFGHIKKASSAHHYPEMYYQYFTLSYLDRHLNTIQEVYYDIKKDSTYLWINTIRATQDGGCIVAGDFWDFISYPQFHWDHVHSVLKKFPAEVFVNIEEAHNNGLSVAVAYPNPGYDKFCIRTTLTNAELELFDMMGRLVRKQTITDTETIMNAETWASGTYIWRVIQHGKTVETGKWVKM